MTHPTSTMRAAPLLALAVSLAACSAPRGGASYNASTGMTTFESTSIPLGQSTTSGYGSGTELVMSAEAECMGEGCVPETFVISISNPTANEMSTDYEQVVFMTPEGSVSFQPGSQTNGETTQFFSSGRGELVRISLPRDIYTTFATSRDFSVQLGSRDYRVPYAARASMRRLLPTTEG